MKVIDFSLEVIFLPFFGRFGCLGGVFFFVVSRCCFCLFLGCSDFNGLVEWGC